MKLRNHTVTMGLACLCVQVQFLLVMVVSRAYLSYAFRFGWRSLHQFALHLLDLVLLELFCAVSALKICFLPMLVL